MISFSFFLLGHTHLSERQHSPKTNSKEDDSEKKHRDLNNGVRENLANFAKDDIEDRLFDLLIRLEVVVDNTTETSVLLGRLSSLICKTRIINGKKFIYM